MSVADLIEDWLKNHGGEVRAKRRSADLYYRTYSDRGPLKIRLLSSYEADISLAIEYEPLLFHIEIGTRISPHHYWAVFRLIDHSTACISIGDGWISGVVFANRAPHSFYFSNCNHYEHNPISSNALRQFLSIIDSLCRAPMETQRTILWSYCANSANLFPHYHKILWRDIESRQHTPNNKDLSIFNLIFNRLRKKTSNISYEANSLAKSLHLSELFHHIKVLTIRNSPWSFLVPIEEKSEKISPGMFYLSEKIIASTHDRSTRIEVDLYRLTLPKKALFIADIIPRIFALSTLYTSVTDIAPHQRMKSLQNDHGSFGCWLKREDISRLILRDMLKPFAIALGPVRRGPYR